MGLNPEKAGSGPGYPSLAEHREPRCRWRKLAALAAALAAFGAVAYGGGKLCLPLIEKIFYPQQRQFRIMGDMAAPVPQTPPAKPGQGTNGP